MVITLDNVLRSTVLIYTGLDGWQSLDRRPPLHVGIYIPLRMSCRSDDLRNGSVGSDYDPPGFCNMITWGVFQTNNHSITRSRDSQILTRQDCRPCQTVVRSDHALFTRSSQVYPIEL